MPATETIPILTRCPTSVQCNGCKEETTDVGVEGNTITVRCRCLRTSFYYADDFILVQGNWYTVGSTVMA